MSFYFKAGVMKFFKTVAHCLDFSEVKPGTEVNGTLVTTGSNWLAFSTPNARGMKLLLSYTGTSGDFNTLSMRARSNSAYPVVCGNFSASAGQNNHGNLSAVQGYAQPNAYTNTDASNIVNGVYSCIDAGGASTGRRWSTWIDDHSTTKASGGHYLCRMSQNGTVEIDGAFTVYTGGRLPFLFNFEDAAVFLTDAGDAGSTKAGYIAVKTPAGTKYIQLVTT